MKIEKKISEWDESQYLRVAARHLIDVFGGDEIWISDTHFEVMTENGIEWKVEPQKDSELKLIPDDSNLQIQVIPCINQFLKTRNYMTNLIEKSDRWFSLDNVLN